MEALEHGLFVNMNMGIGSELEGRQISSVFVESVGAPGIKTKYKCLVVRAVQFIKSALDLLVIYFLKDILRNGRYLWHLQDLSRVSALGIMSSFSNSLKMVTGRLIN